MAELANSKERTPERGIILSSPAQRARALRSAHRNSWFVATLRIMLPIAVLGLLTNYIVSMQMSTKIEDDTHRGTFSISSADLLATKPTMRNPTYSGYNKKDGTEYTIRADRAITDMNESKPIDLFGIEAHVRQQDGTAYKMTADDGKFDRNQNKLELFNDIVVASNDMTARLSHATILPRQSLVTSDKPVAIQFPAGKLDGNKLRIEQKKNKFLLYGGVKAQLYSNRSNPGKQPAPSKTATGLAAFAGTSNKPVDVKSKNLVVHTQQQSARFAGGVSVTQSNARLTAKIMDIAYTAASSVGGGAADVNKITARQDVVITRDGDRAETEIAIFDTAKNTAELIGGVVLSSGTDRTITGDRALLDGAKDTMVVTGQVLVKQGENVMRGTRLDYDQQHGKLSLTDGTKSGRIKAKFVRQDSTPLQVAQGTKAGSSLSENPAGLFKTDPNSTIDVAATRLDVDEIKRQATFKGDVLVTQGQFTIRTAIIHANYSGSSNLATGNNAANKASSQSRQPVQLTSIYAPEFIEVETDQGQYASGKSGEFDSKRNEIHLIGDVVLKQGRQLVQGDRLIVNLTSGLSRVVNKRPSSQAIANSGADAKPESKKNTQNSTACGGRMCATFFPDDIRNTKKSDQSNSRTAPSRNGSSDDDDNTAGVATGWVPVDPSTPSLFQPNQ